MSEVRPTQPTDPVPPQIPAETLPAGREVLLEHNSLVLARDSVLYDVETTRRAFGYNGAIVAKLILPTETSPTSGEDKVLGIIDFGESMPPEGRAILFNPIVNRELPNIKVTHNRYGLVTLNYKPEELLAGYVSLPFGTNTTIGRDKVNNSYPLGLNNKGNGSLSRSHATVTIGKFGKITITDHSLNHTKVMCS